MSNIMLTHRDEKLIHDCYKNAVLSISQIRSRHFPSCGKATALNRLSKLKRQGYLRSQRVGIVIYQGLPKKIGAVYQTTRSGIAYLKSRRPTQVFREEPIQLNTSSLPHDLLLTDVITALKDKYPGKEVVRGGLLPQLNQAKRIPDAGVLDSSGKPIVAIELELTAKSNERYREIILNYRLSDFPSVHYIAADYGILEKIKSHVIQGKVIPGLPEPSTGKFSFVLLSDLLGTNQNKQTDQNLIQKGN